MIGRKIAMVMALAVAASMMLVGTALANGKDRYRDGLSDENASTVKSFEDDVLTLTLAGGGELSAKVTDDTDIECGSDPGDHGHHHGHKGHKHHGHKHHRGHKGHKHHRGHKHHKGRHRDNEDCGADALVPGTKVLEAALKVKDGEAVWTEVELLKP